ncbi:MAG: DMT family transporter [Bacteroidales bacterium]|nr:DMT family transporter [Bacteroidales bacterium]
MHSTFLAQHLKLHFIVLIYGFTAILGKLIELDPVELVWYRMLIAAISIGVFLKIKKISFRIAPGLALRFVLIGFIVAGHWIAFFGAIRLSNISVTLGCLASTTLFTSILEPVFEKKRPDKVEVIIGILIILGLYLIFQFEFRYWQGILTALAAALLAALFTVLNKIQVASYPARVISFYEMAGGWVGISLFMLVNEPSFTGLLCVSAEDGIYLLLLGIVCTAFAYVVQVDVMRQLSAYIVSLAINLEPVYGIILAYLIFGDSELMSAGFYIGTILIILSAIGYPVYSKRIRRRPDRA